MLAHHLTAASLLALSCAACTTAQDTPSREDADVLGGPKVVEDASSADTLVERSLTGEMRRIEGMPEITALDRLELTSQQRAAVDDALAERGAIVDRLVIEHRGMVETLLARGRQQNPQPPADGEQGQPRRGNTQERAEQMRDVVSAFRPMLERGTLGQEITRALPADQRERFDALVDEYREALRAQHAEQRAGGEMMPADRPRPEPSPERIQRMTDTLTERMGEDGELIARFLTDRTAYQSFLQELGVATKRVISNAAGQMETFLDSIEATPEQRTQIENLLKSLRDTPREERRAKLREVLQTLEPDQRRQVVQYLRDRRGTDRPRPEEEQRQKRRGK